MSDRDVSEEVVAIINPSGRCLAQFAGLDAKTDAGLFLRDCHKGAVQCLRGARIIDGRDAKRAITRGRI